MSGAAESILQDILIQANLTNVHLAKMLRESGVASGTTSPVTAPAREAGKAMGALAVSSYLVGAAFGFVKKAADSVVTAYSNNVVSLYGFSKAASLGEAKLGEFYSAFSQTPIIGKFFGVLGDMYSYQETILESWKSLSNVGATLGGSLMEVRNLAHASGLSISEFTSFVGQNSETLALFGSSVSSGTKKFVAMQSETREAMMAFGYTSKESAEVLALFTRSQGTMNKQSMVNSLSQTEAAISFAKELKLASDLTGQNNEELRKQVEAAQADNAWQVYMSTITDDKERQKLQNELNRQIAQNGKDGERMFKEVAATGTIQTEASARFAAATQNQALIAIQNNLALIRSGAEEEDVRASFIKGQLKVGAGAMDSAVKLGAALYAMQANGDEFASSANTTMKNFTAFNERYKNMTDEDMKKELKKMELENKKTVQLQEQQNQMRKFASGFVDSIFGVIAPLVTPLDAFAKGIISITQRILPTFKSLIEQLASPDIMGKLSNVIAYLANLIADTAISSITSFSKIIDGFAKGGFSGGLLQILSEIKGFFSNASAMWDKNGPAIVAAIKDTFSKVQPVLESIWKELKPSFEKMFNGMMTMVIAGVLEWAKPDYVKRYEAEKLRQEKEQKTSGTQPAGFDSLQNTVNLLRAVFDQAPVKSSTATPNPGKSLGSLGTTGKLFENWGAGTDVTLHGTEAVVTPAQMGGIINNSLAGELQTLNRQVAELLKYNKETAEYARRNVDATTSLSGNLFA
jgi:hypothetical protein